MLLASSTCHENLRSKNACILVDLLLHWKYEERPKLRVSVPLAAGVPLANSQAFFLAVEFIIGIAIGYM